MSQLQESRCRRLGMALQCKGMQIDEQSPTLDQLIGDNLRRLREREGLSQDEVARRARRHGLQSWTRSSVAAAEAENSGIGGAAGNGMAARNPGLDFVTALLGAGLGDAGYEQQKYRQYS